MPERKDEVRYCVLDDETAFLDLAQQYLKKYLPRVKGLFLSDPQKALDLAKGNPRVLYIVDIRLGDRNGIDLYHDINRIAPHSRVIFITGDSAYLTDTELRERALLRGGIDFVEKPVKWTELALKMQNHLKLIEYQFELEEKVEERTNQLVHADRLATVGTMVSSIVHEVNTPLTSSKMNIELAQRLLAEKDPSSGADPQSLLEDALRGIRQVEDLLKSFRRFYKQEKTLLALELPSIIEDIRTLVVYNLRRQGIQFSVENRLSSPLTVWGNRQELIQAFANIINNAIDSFEGSSLKDCIIKVTIALQDPKTISVSIANNGPKIPEEVLPKVFEPFFTTKSGDRGTGLGLFIVKQIMRGMGGDVVVHNREGGNNFVEFVCTMPVYHEQRKTRVPA